MKSSSQKSAGKSRSFLETGRFGQGVKAQIPVLTVTGTKKGPLAVIMAAQHGRELNGIASIERAFNRLRPAALSGTVVFLPVMNPVAVRTHAQDFPTEKPRYRPCGMRYNMNLNRSWPGGDNTGASTYVAAIADAVWNTYMRHADVGIDLHGWSGLSLCLAWAAKSHRDHLRAFGLPWHMTIEKPGSSQGLTEYAALQKGIPWITCELVPQNRICNESVLFGERGILNTLRFSGLLKEPLDLPPVQYEFKQEHEETLIRTPAEGLVVSDFKKGDWVTKGQTVLRVLSLETLKSIFEFKAAHDGLVFNIGGTHWGEDIPENAVVFPGQIVGLLKQPTRILKNRL
jgi:predicted deacylase